ncbi:reverse transcriptase domain-containing protein [Streptomyces sp. NBC_01474]|uniref:reverse transcriptase domain-containing protein n=1 Tax=unclassified Streptomyces TaxID=2593676 RepID=UPI002DDA4226|nr:MULTISPECIES: reverse transcriptase domain-containing protein [unclassified Streptomyces]WSD94648.1 reverse transcriptase domain-containing protein [Streptomyces sp. NBC_01474]
MGQLKSSTKPFEISKWEVKEAWEEVRGNKGAPGVDGQSIADFEKDLRNNLYKVWNRMSSGSYFPPPVRAVAIPKPHGGGERMLGIPAVADRVAQTVVARHLMRRVEPVFHPDSFGYRPGRSALDAVGKCRERCWKRDWVVEFDIAKFFDSVPWDLLVNAVEAHTDAVWVKLYVRRWLAAPLVMPDGSLLERERGTPQGNAAYLRNGKDFDVGWVRVTGRGFGAEFLPVGMDVDTLDGSWTTAVPSARVESFDYFCICLVKGVREAAGGKIPPGR